MKPVLALLLLAAAALPVRAQEVSTRLLVAEAQVAVGEPVECTLVVEHPPGSAVALPRTDYPGDYSWECPSDFRVSTRRSPGSWTTTARWQLLSLEGGERELPLLRVELALDGVPQLLAVQPATVVVASALHEDEDSPRPPAGFRELPADLELRGFPTGVVLWTVCVAALVALAAVLALRPRRGARRVGPPSVEARLGEVAGAQSPAELREACYELARLLRAAWEERAGFAAPGLTDEEWLYVLGRLESASPVQHAAVEAQLESLARVKFGVEQPTRWAWDELLEGTRGLLEAARRPAAQAEDAA